MQEKLACDPQRCGHAPRGTDEGIVELEAARAKLHFLGKKFGLTSPLTLQQSRLVDELIFLQMRKEKVQPDLRS